MKHCKSLLLLSFLFLALPRTALPQTDNAELESALKNYFSSYSRPDFHPDLTVALDYFYVDEPAKTLDVYGNEGFSSQSFTPQLTDDIYRNLLSCLPQPYNTYTLRIYAFEKEITTLIPNIYIKEKDKKRLWGNLNYEGNPWTENISQPFRIENGLQNRHLVVWASHGRYYNFNSGDWVWQRPALYMSTEDLFTQSFVIPFLIPMLENSGAVVFTPRERDWQKREIIVDNDKTETGYSENNRKDKNGWRESTQSGFTQNKNVYLSGENPFTDGTARIIHSTHNAGQTSTCQWTPHIKETGNYAVYVTYQSFDNSIDDAVYTVRHQGVSTKIRVNQQMGGSTWVYLGNYNFSAGTSADNCVLLSNISKRNGLVSADAVRFGGGMGNIARGDSVLGEYASGMPRYLEGARYAAQWYGMPDSAYNTKDGRNDYADDINARSRSLNFLGGGSVYIPDSCGKRVPFELSLAVHSDAGVAAGNRTVGTLAVHTLDNGNGENTFRSGVSRLASSDFASILQNTVYGDLKHLCPNTSWTRREIFNRNYSETRVPEVPSAIIEMLSHQNFTDMKYGHDPNFKFYMSRAIYKGVLKFVSGQHGVPYTVQPLPVRNFSARLNKDNGVTLSWSPTPDPLEPSATPTGYVVYVRQNDNDFDNGTVVGNDTTLTLPVQDDTLYSFKVCALNDGGKSFPSEVLSAMRASDSESEVLIVNGFTRLSAPAVMDTPDQAGFDFDRDMGVAYQRTTEYCGRQTNFDRHANHSTGPEGMGHSGQELQNILLTGNTFDYPYIHGVSIKNAGCHSFSSCSVGAFMNGTVPPDSYNVLDLILGLQKDDGESSIVKYKSFPPALRDIMTHYLDNGGNLFISGSYLVSDMTTEDERAFTNRVLHYAAADDGTSRPDSAVAGNNIHFGLTVSLDATRYAVTHPDRLAPTTGAFPFLTYSDGSCAGIAYAGKKATIIALGFPFESISDKASQDKLMRACLQMYPK